MDEMNRSEESHDQHNKLTDSRISLKELADLHISPLKLGIFSYFITLFTLFIYPGVGLCFALVLGGMSSIPKQQKLHFLISVEKTVCKDQTNLLSNALRFECSRVFI